tara:strand:- start:748 stop:924 length:177 start_codon:yes stop_codon:yes gene_type:complete
MGKKPKVVLCDFIDTAVKKSTKKASFFTKEALRLNIFCVHNIYVLNMVKINKNNKLVF